MRKTYPTDLSDEEWTRLKTHLPASKLLGRPRAHSLRDVLDAIFYVLRSGCPWRFLPSDFPPWSTVYYHFRRFRRSGIWHLLFASLRTAARHDDVFEHAPQQPDSRARATGGSETPSGRRSY